jgi:hypothetical protein
VIKAKYGLDACNVGDEGGFAPNIQNNEEALIMIMEAIKNAGYEGKFKICMDPASSEFFRKGKYDLKFKSNDGKGSPPEEHITPQQLTDVCVIPPPHTHTHRQHTTTITTSTVAATAATTAHLGATKSWVLIFLVAPPPPPLPILLLRARVVVSHTGPFCNPKCRQLWPLGMLAPVRLRHWL